MSEKKRDVLAAITHGIPEGMPKGELFLGFDFLDHYFGEWTGDYVSQLKAAGEMLDLSLLGIDLNRPWSRALLKQRGYRILSDMFTVGFVNGPMSVAVDRLGLFKAMMAIRTRREVFSEISEEMTRAMKKTAMLVKENNISAIAVADDIAGNRGLLFSPRDFAEVLLPIYRAMAEAIKAQGLCALFHCDGDTRGIIPALAEAGYDCIHPVDTQAGMDLYDLQETHGGRVAFMGHIDAVAWEEGRAREEIGRAAGAFREGGLILGSSGGISMETITEGMLVLYPNLSSQKDGHR